MKEPGLGNIFYIKPKPNTSAAQESSTNTQVAQPTATAATVAHHERYLSPDYNGPVPSTSIPRGNGGGTRRRRTAHRKRKSHRKSKRASHTRRKHTRRHRR